MLRGDGETYLRRCVAPGRQGAGPAGGGEQVHMRLYSVSCAVLAPVFGANVFGLELVNLPLFLLMLFLTYKIGETCHGARAALPAAAVAGLFPSLLLHSTQPLRDPLFVVLMLAFIWVLVRLLAGRVSAGAGAALAAGGAAALALLWLVRDGLSPVYVGVVGLALVALAGASLRDGRVSPPNLACLLILLAAALLVPRTFPAWLPPKEPLSPEQQRALDKFADEQTRAGMSGFLLRLSVARHKFVVLYPEAGSNIDAGLAFRGPRDVVAYLPRAALVGLFAPFPSQWFEEGKEYGRAGRAVAGVETCLVYALTFFAAAGAPRARRLPQTWFLLGAALLGATALGLVVVNAGALYRMRYTFLILFVVLGADSLRRQLSLGRPGARAAGREGESA